MIPIVHLGVVSHLKLISLLGSQRGLLVCVVIVDLRKLSSKDNCDD